MGPGCLVCPWAVARPRAVRAACCCLWPRWCSGRRRARPPARLGPHFVRRRASKPARALRSLRRPPHRRRLVADMWLGASARCPASPRHRPLISHVIPLRLVQSLNLHRWNCNVFGVSRKMTTINYVRNLGGGAAGSLIGGWARRLEAWPGPVPRRVPYPQFRMQFPNTCSSSLSEKPGISTITFQSMKCAWGNCMRMCADRASPPPTGTAAWPSGPSGALHTGGAWSLIGGSARRIEARPGPAAAHGHRSRVPLLPVGVTGVSRVEFLGCSGACCYKRRQSKVFFVWISVPLLQTSSIRGLFRRKWWFLGLD